mmetsp:Transcript_47910/g.109005  ORF Transcript_47910/g.109005 Transcript_47910/m.109005 type:complete len:199 (-) Transcript_47910:102-698(-)
MESTLEYARIDQERRQQLRNEEHLRMAQDLHRIVVMMCTRNMSSEERRPFKQNNGLGILGRLRGLNKSAINEEHVTNSECMRVQVSRAVFDSIIREPQVRQILEDLEISVHNEFKLFDIIDSNGNGFLDVTELVEGLLKLRGPADKGDAVCAALMVRTTQRQLQRVETDIARRLKVVNEKCGKLLVALEQRERQMCRL